jgi:hypothetical protein
MGQSSAKPASEPNYCWSRLVRGFLHVLLARSNWLLHLTTELLETGLGRINYEWQAGSDDDKILSSLEPFALQFLPQFSENPPHPRAGSWCSQCSPATGPRPCSENRLSPAAAATHACLAAGIFNNPACSRSQFARAAREPWRSVLSINHHRCQLPRASTRRILKPGRRKKVA